MLIYNPDPYYIADYETKIITTAHPGYELPIVLIDPRSVTPLDEELLSVCAEYPPRTRFRRGDLALITGDIPLKLRRDHERIPRVWEVRFVVSKWAREAMLTLQSTLGADLRGPDQLRSFIDNCGGLGEYQRETPVIYAHGYPHGIYPNSLAWLPEHQLKRIPFRDPIQPWRDVVESAGSHFYGYDSNGLVKPFGWELAPDDYSHGSNLGRPFNWEEPNVETLCLGGLEEHLFDPIIIGQTRRRKKLDPDHDFLQEK